MTFVKSLWTRGPLILFFVSLALILALLLGPVFSFRVARWESVTGGFEPASESFYIAAAPVAVGLLIAAVVANDYLARSAQHLPELRSTIWRILAIFFAPLLTYVLVGLALAGSLRALLHCHVTKGDMRVCGNPQTLDQAKVGIGAGAVLLLAQLVVAGLRTVRSLMVESIAKLSPERVPNDSESLFQIGRTLVSARLDDATDEAK